MQHAQSLCARAEAAHLIALMVSSMRHAVANATQLYARALLAVLLPNSLMLILPTMNLLSTFSIPLASNTLFPSLLPSSAVLMLIVRNMIFLILISSNPSLSFLRRQQPFPPLHSVNPLRLVSELPHPPLTLPLPLLPPATSTLQEFWEQARLAQSALLNTRGQEEQSH